LFIAFAIFEQRDSRDDAARAIDRGSIFTVRIKPSGCNHVTKYGGTEWQNALHCG
jgi:hypothetical protein